jgi:hypothetical protein
MFQVKAGNEKRLDDYPHEPKKLCKMIVSGPSRDGYNPLVSQYFYHLVLAFAAKLPYIFWKIAKSAVIRLVKDNQ